MKKQFKYTFLSVAISTALSSSIVFAQDNEDAIKDVEVIKVTGSRIPTDPNATSSVPLQSINAEDIKLSGELNLADIVADIPALISSTTSENSTTGANSLNLRGLGSERTLTLVNGRRHVSGFRGSSAVDVSSIPRALVESVEVTTGGASAIYGADAVTGVVNFILKDDYEGIKIDAQAGIPTAGGGETFGIDAIVGQNFDNDKGNIVFTATYQTENKLTQGDRDWSKGNQIAFVQTNPNYDSGAAYDPNNPPKALIEDGRFWLTSQEGSIAPGFDGREQTYVDINNNGIADCQESEGGRTGYLAGCWVTNPDGSVRVNQDGTVLNGLWGIGGDGGRTYFDRDTLMPSTDKMVFNLNSKYDLTDDLSFFVEAKYVTTETSSFSELDTYYDTLEISADNPYIPSELQSVADDVGYLLLTQDPVDFTDDNESVYTRETTRFVAGLEYFTDNHSFELSITHGQFKQTDETTSYYQDRQFAAMDAVEDGNGNIVCRSDLDSNAAYNIDYFTASSGLADGSYSSSDYYSFTPGDGQCAPLNPFGTYSTSQEARDFISAHLTDELTIEQTVVSFIASGEFDWLDSILDGSLGYASGLEYREESSEQELDERTLGILPEGTPHTAGQNVNDIYPYINSYLGIDNVQEYNTQGEYDVMDAFVEVRLPILQDREFAKELSLDAALRVADYSTVGQTTTWKLGMSYSPIDDISFRGTVSEAVRAPNISELFDPRLNITVSATADPCDPSNISPAIEANCIAHLKAKGVAESDIVDASGNYIWTNPLTGRFTGTSGGNPELEVETAETLTFGVVLKPSVIEGLIVTIDYWDIQIESAILAVGSSDILRGCYESKNYPNVDFCDDFERRADGGLTDLTTGQINFAKQDAEGIDLSINYSFALGENEFNVSLIGSQQKVLDNYFNPLDLTDVNTDLEEIQVPKTSGNAKLSWARGDLSVAFQTTYQSRQSKSDDVESVLGSWDEEAMDWAIRPEFGNDGYFDDVIIHDINASYTVSDSLSVFGGINNLTDLEPFSTQTAWPVGPRGRTVFLGMSYSM
jgi:outer membrane receptor protein involved in Fe transport